MRSNILVSVCCLAYNHEPFIRQCLEGFIMQKTNFKFEVLIHDDASTDNTADIIREYEERFPEIIKPVYQTKNQYSKGIDITQTIQYPRAKGKYIALCEGDDYWIDPNKLQRQVEFLENHEEYGLCYTDCMIYNQALDKYRKSKTVQVNRESLIIENRIPTLTTCFRKKLYMRYINEIVPSLPNLPMGDLPMWLFFSNISKIKKIDMISSVYRELESSASHCRDINDQIDFHEASRKCKDFFYEKFDYEDDIKKKYNAFVDVNILYKIVLFDSQTKFKEYAYLIPSVFNYSILLWLYFRLVQFSYCVFCPIARIMNLLRYK